MRPQKWSGQQKPIRELLSWTNNHIPSQHIKGEQPYNKPLRRHNFSGGTLPFSYVNGTIPSFPI